MGNVKDKLKEPAYPGQTLVGKALRYPTKFSVLNRLTGFSPSKTLFQERPPAGPKKPPLTTAEAARIQAEDRARVQRLRAQAGFSGTSAIYSRPTVGGGLSGPGTVG